MGKILNKLLDMLTNLLKIILEHLIHLIAKKIQSGQLTSETMIPSLGNLNSLPKPDVKSQLA